MHKEHDIAYPIPHAKFVKKDSYKRVKGRSHTVEKRISMLAHMSCQERKFATFDAVTNLHRTGSVGCCHIATYHTSCGRPPGGRLYAYTELVLCGTTRLHETHDEITGVRAETARMLPDLS